MKIDKVWAKVWSKNQEKTIKRPPAWTVYEQKNMQIK